MNEILRKAYRDKDHHMRWFPLCEASCWVIREITNLYKELDNLPIDEIVTDLGRTELLVPEWMAAIGLSLDHLRGDRSNCSYVFNRVCKLLSLSTKAQKAFLNLCKTTSRKLWSCNPSTRKKIIRLCDDFKALCKGKHFRPELGEYIDNNIDRLAEFQTLYELQTGDDT